MKANIAAALVLAIGMVASVLTYERAEDARIERRERQIQCAKAKDARDNCNTFFTTPESQQRCHRAWDPEVGDKCYGIKPSPVADKDLFK